MSIGGGAGVQVGAWHICSQASRAQAGGQADMQAFSHLNYSTVQYRTVPIHVYPMGQLCGAMN